MAPRQSNNRHDTSYGAQGGHVANADPVDEPVRSIDDITLRRLAAIKDQLHQIETRLGVIGEISRRLDEIHTILETVIGFVTPDQINQSSAKPTPP